MPEPVRLVKAHLAQSFFRLAAGNPKLVYESRTKYVCGCTTENCCVAVDIQPPDWVKG